MVLFDSPLDDTILVEVAAATGAVSAQWGERIQQLWSGYGELRRVRLEGADVPTVVVKCVRPPASPQHQRGWATDRGHARKLRSYAVEMAWYVEYSNECAADCRVPSSLHCDGRNQAWTFVLEDLDAAGFRERHQTLNETQLHACIEWLAHFHATFLDREPTGLWPEGTYWHLDTRPDELAAMPAGQLRSAAAEIDSRLRSARYRTLVHGDAKVTNFCFPSANGPVAAVDFQYVGGGCGMKDVIYFLSSCLDERSCARRAPTLLDSYFSELRGSLIDKGRSVDADALEAEWRALYPFAWADFCRFLGGWAPDHHKLHGYSRAMTEQALSAL